jgi:hypothetical protein
MNSTTIEMTQSAALEKLESYERAIEANPRAATTIDLDVMRGYKVLARGGRLLEVNAAIVAAGLNLAGQPKLAISRAHVSECHWQAQTTYTWDVATGKGEWQLTGGCHYIYNPERRRVTDERVRWTLPALSFTGKLSRLSIKALTPFIPLPVRPRHNLSNYFLLWEANWHPSPPVDPYLLRPVAGSLMEILAEWDVSPVELAAVRHAMQSVKQ